MPDLFDYARQQDPPQEPLAARLRPRRLEDFVGQETILGEGRLLRRAIQADQLSSLILWGGVGTGKTTLANIIAHQTKRAFLRLNAVTDGVAQLRELIQKAQDERKLYGRGAVLFVDEIHRWNKAQQDGLLPFVEDGTVVLIGATTENPFFSLVNALLSRSRVIRLEALTPAHIRQILQRALSDTQHGYGKLAIRADEAALAHWAEVAGGDARSALNALELAVLTTPPAPDGVIHLTLEVAQESIQRRVMQYDRGEDEHYDTASAFIKSVRGSDPDAALYWLGKMLLAGEDPRFIWRRLLILTCEDIGLADPQALLVVNAAAEAFERVGQPEGYYLFAHATLYCATAPKSNSAKAIFSALDHLEAEGPAPVPPHLCDKSRVLRGVAREKYQETIGDLPEYLYPHDYPQGWVAQNYLPEGLPPPHWYQPSEQGFEAGRAAEWRARRGGV